MSLLLHYKCNDNAANATVDDASGNGRNGTFLASTTPTNTNTVDATGKVNGALSFATASKHNIKYDAAVTPAGSYSMAAWVNFASFGAAGNVWIACQRSATSGAYQNWQWFRYKPDNDHIRWMLWTASGSYLVTVLENPSLATWYHMAIVVDVSTHKITPYLNGTAGTQADFVGTPYNGSANLRISGTSWASPIDLCIDGLVDDFRIYDEALNTARIGLIYHAGAGTEIAKPWAARRRRAICGG